MKIRNGISTFFYTIIILVGSTILHAGADPCGATVISNDMSDPETHSTVGLGDSGIDASAFNDYYGDDGWYEFTSTGGDLFLNIFSLGISNPAIAIYEDTGDCTDPLLIYYVVDDNCNFTDDPSIHFDDLDVGSTYYIRVWSEDGSPGDFDILLTKSINPITDFVTHGDAMQVGDCIYLTEDMNSQNGCAWFTVPIDFSQSFTHEMYLNFGTNNNGADGITLVYQPDPDQPCGFLGGGIGVDGMPNTAIFEFDTWQNGPGQYNDPPQDHANFFTNGDITHGGANDINGPALLGDIEDGADHHVTFEWVPPDMYTLTFDGVIILQGNYDIVNNIFGGNPIAYWGFTSATGSANNDHIVCPVYAYTELGTQSYEEMTICYGESYSGYTEDGFYTEIVGGAGECSHQNNIRLHVVPEATPGYIDTLICNSTMIEIEGVIFDEEGTTDINLFTADGCDSLLVVTVDVFTAEIDVHQIEELDCSNDIIKLYIDFSTNIYLEATEYEIFWENPNDGITYHTDTLEVTESGTYFGFVIVDYEELVGCEFYFEYTVDDFVSIPEYFDPPDVLLECGQEDVYLYIDYDNVNQDLSWSLDGTVVSSVDSVLVSGPGTYIYTLSEGDCSITDSVLVVGDDDLPTIMLDSGTLNCDRDRINLNPTVTGDIMIYTWTYNDVLISDQLDPGLVSEDGIYTLTVTDKNGCIITQSATVTIDTLAPVLSLVDPVIPCDTDSIDVVHDFDDSYIITWTGPNFVSSNEDIRVADEGIYFASLTNPANGCESLDSFTLTTLGNSPELSFTTSTLNCSNEMVDIVVMSDIPGVTYMWDFEGDNIGTEEIISVSNPGNYNIIATTSTGCETLDTTAVMSLYTTPVVVSTSAIEIDCDNPSVMIQTEIEDGDIFSWTGPSGYTSDDSQPEVSLEGMYFVTVTNSLTGCTVIDSIEVFKDPDVLVYELNPGTISCHDPEINLDLVISSSYESVTWTGPGSFNSTEVSPLITLPGTYTLHIEVAGDCDIDTEVVITGDLVPPSYSVGYVYIDCNFPTTLVDITTDDVNTVVLTTPLGQTYSDDVTIGEGETGVFSILVTAPNGCYLEENFTINEDFEVPSLILSGGDIIDCINLSTQIQLSTEEGVSIDWSGPDGFTHDDNNISVSQPGTYYASIISSNGCENLDSILIMEDNDPPLLELNSDGDIDCIMTSVNIVAITTGTGNSFSWIGPDYSSTEQDITIEKGGTYMLNITGANGCTTTEDIFIDENINIIDVEASGNDIDCEITEAELTFNTGSNYDFVSWVGPNNTSSSDEDWTVTNEGMYTISLIDEYGCEGLDTVYVSANNNPPTVDLITPVLVELIGNEEGEIEIEVSSDNDYTIQWLPEIGLSCYDCLSPRIIGEQELINYTVTITSTNGCFDDLSLSVRRAREIIVSVPNIISKGSNGNTHVTLYGNENVKRILEFYVYDRWGNLMFEIKDIPPSEPSYGWDGEYEGKKVVNGVYTYLFVIETTSGDTRKYAGDVTVFD